MVHQANLLLCGTLVLDQEQVEGKLAISRQSEVSWCAGNGACALGDTAEASDAAESLSAEEASSGDEWTAERGSRRSRAQRAKQQQRDKPRRAKAAQLRHQRSGAAAAAGLPAEQEPTESRQPDTQQPVITIKASARAAQVRGLPSP